jgi:hypothetical protein
MYAVVKVDLYDGAQTITMYETRIQAKAMYETKVQALCPEDDDWTCFNVIGPLQVGVETELDPNPCDHEETYCNDRMQSICRDCGEELGR